MKKHLSKSIFFAATFVILAIIIEMVTFITLGFGVLPKYFFLDLAIILIIATLVFAIPNTIVQAIVGGFVLVVQMVLSYINITLYDIYGDLFSIDMFRLGGEAFMAFDPSDINGLFSVFVLATTGLYIFLAIKACKNKTKFAYKSKLAIIVLAIFIINQAVFLGSYFLQYRALQVNTTSEFEEYFVNDAGLYESLVFKVDALQKFGTYSFYVKSVGNILDNADLTEEEYTEVYDYITSGEMSEVNASTGLIEGNNVIVIMVESWEWFSVDPIFTPTLYSMAENGYTFNNYYSKNKTNISETDVVLGNQPTSLSFFENYFTEDPDEVLEVPFTLPNKLREEGFTSVKYFHDYLSSFYRRYLTHPKLGFDEVVDMNDMNIADAAQEFHNFVKDSDMIKNVIEEIAPTDERFFSFITTVTSHGPFQYNYRLEDYYDELADPVLYAAFVDWFTEEYTEYDYPADEEMLDYFLKYKAAIMDFDRGMEYLLEYLEDNNMADNTTIVLYGDHNAYYNGLTYSMKDIGDKVFYNTELYRVPCLIYDTTLGAQQVTDFACVFNITPTLLDLLSVSYNQNLYAGYSLFSSKADDTIFVSRIGGIMRNDIYSDNVVDIVNEETFSVADIQKFREDALTYFIKQGYINKIYKHNVFAKNSALLSYV